MLTLTFLTTAKTFRIPMTTARVTKHTRTIAGPAARNSDGKNGRHTKETKNSAAKMENPQIKNKSKEYKKAIMMTKTLYLDKLPWAILLAAIPMRRMFVSYHLNQNRGQIQIKFFITSQT